MSSTEPGTHIPDGSKFLSPQGTPAVKGGIKPNAASAMPDADRKPPWLRVKLPAGARYEDVRQIVHTNKLNTVCAESKCPNIAECWGRGTATLMLMGSVCTRACKFCAVSTGNPHGWLDPLEPIHVAEAVALMKLEYVVLTSVDRDDLADGGAAHYAACIRAIHEHSSQTAVEALTPDFAGNLGAVATVLDAGLITYAQNLETVERLTHPVRDQRAGYNQTLGVLAFAKRHAPNTLTKTSLMLGLGETDAEIERTLDDVRDAHVDVVTLGQYMRPSPHHLPVQRFVTPEQFLQYRELALSKGFLEAVAGPLVRSSYRAERVLEHNNLGL
ncbi:MULTISPECIES: lipoyl synthase [unclassified Rhodanobacter]|nr:MULTISPECIES: lipoyl synthase [unclassified Rhodanobacter]OOG38544.1 lipoyl synthase [Rhodanobacter sp. C05]OOG50117.1 lipoyl synthase [Rhodanobacter sp. C01]OOG52303.1 lipoyl synthase [Rhodanobacter sp. C03]OOG65964.1 lipoyl synthase [Rhodanobacter sp. B04]